MNPFPGYPHIGPGNKILDKANNALDAIAREHDIAYNIAKSTEDIAEADKRFINKLSEFETTSVYEWLVVQISRFGILTKFYIENIIGVVYPKLSHAEKIKLNVVINNYLNNLGHNNRRRRKLRKLIIENVWS